MSNLISEMKLMTDCKIGKGAACCRYLTGGSQGFECAKHNSLKATIDRRVEAGTFTAMGDNCEGLQ